MANEEQLSILKQGTQKWNTWRIQNPDVDVDLTGADLSATHLHVVLLMEADLSRANLTSAFLSGANLRGANLTLANLFEANLFEARLNGAKLSGAKLSRADLSGADLTDANLEGSNLLKAVVGSTIFGNSDLSKVLGLEDVVHRSPSRISTELFVLSKGKIPEDFLRGCGLSDWEVELVKLYNPDLGNEEISKILYKMYDIRASQAIQIFPLFISYSHSDSEFVDKIGDSLTKKGIRYWRDLHDATAGRLEKQIDRAIRQNPTVLLILSSNSIESDWVEHEVRTARGLEKEMGRDVLCPVALDDSWKSSRWRKRVMEQIMEYNILDFSAWKDDSKFESMFRKLIDGLELFYKGEAYGE